MSFEDYLAGLGHQPGTVKKYPRIGKSYRQWLRSWDITESEIRYEDLLSYLEALEKRGLSPKSRHQHMTGLRHYYAYLVKQGKTESNPALGLHIKSRRLLPNNLLDQEELASLYQSYVEAHPQTGHLMNRAILGLIIYQAVKSGELLRIKPSHIKLTALKATVYIPATPRTIARTLSLEACQVVDLQVLVHTRKQEPYLFEGLQKGTRRITQRLFRLYQALRVINSKVQHGEQLRQSRISHWVKHHNLRQVQVWAGHRYVSSTERYQQTDTGELAEQLKLFHPRS